MAGLTRDAVLMPDVRHMIAQCPRKDAPSAACGVYYPDLRERTECLNAINPSVVQPAQSADVHRLSSGQADPASAWI
jgi:hypothetical protein